MNNNISTVTMFFDIGRGDWSKQAGIADFADRDNDKYFGYFSHLAQLDNDMVVFTTPNFDERILALRQHRPTRIMHIDLDQQFGTYIDQIAAIQNDPAFIARIPESLRQHPEYRSPKYVLINNLKTYFVNQAINQGLVQHEQVAWVDFGYCRDEQTLGQIRQWRYPFDRKRMHFFTIKRPTYLGFLPNPKFPRTLEKTYQAMFYNKVFIIGSIFVAHAPVWANYLQVLTDCQQRLLSETIIDDDQGVYLMTNILHPELIQLHFLGHPLVGKANWFGVFQHFQQ